MDSMGAKDLEWRTGGSGGGAADGGRDLEAVFYTPTADAEIEAQKWWIECKGRTATVEPDEVKSAVTNASAIEGLDYVVIATNTQFSNPTRDWVKAWQAKNPRPKIKLWDRAQLERYLSRHPEVVLRLFSEALSVEGRLKAMASRFWNKLEFVTPKMLADIWKARNELEFQSGELFALVANEFGSGNITRRPWGAILNPPLLLIVLSDNMFNVPYLMTRCSKAGVGYGVICRTFAYLILAAIEVSSAEPLTDLILYCLNRGEDLFPEDIQETLLMPIMNQLLSEIQDVCSSDCRRISFSDRNTLVAGKDEVDEYWLRLEAAGVEETGERKLLRIEQFDEPCVVGFPADKDNHCPLFETEPTLANTGDLLAIIKRVANFRKTQAAAKRQPNKQTIVQISTKPAASKQ
jgi:Restriction endonuclease